MAQAEVRHDGDDDRLLGQQAPLAPVDGADGDDLVAVDEVAVGVHRQHAVGVAVEREAHIRSQLDDRPAQDLRMRRSASVVDVHAVGSVGHHVDACAGGLEHMRRHLPRGAVGAVEDDVQPREPAAAEGAHQRVDIGGSRRAGPDPSDLAPGGQRQRSAAGDQAIELGLEPFLDGVVELATPSGEELDAVVGEGVVRRGDDRRGDVLACRHPGDARGRQDAKVVDVGAVRAEPGDQCRLQHRTRHPCVAPDGKAGRAEHGGGGPPEGHHQFGRELGVGHAAHTVGAKTKSQLDLPGAAVMGVSSASSTGAPYGPSSGRTSWIPSHGRRGGAGRPA
jgi:hypothetical protein